MENIGCYTLDAAHFPASLPHASLPRSRTCADSSALHSSYSSDVPPKQLKQLVLFFSVPYWNVQVVRYLPKSVKSLRLPCFFAVSSVLQLWDNTCAEPTLDGEASSAKQQSYYLPPLSTGSQDSPDPGCVILSVMRCVYASTSTSFRRPGAAVPFCTAVYSSRRRNSQPEKENPRISASCLQSFRRLREGLSVAEF